ncbi:MAG: hypothetical protein H7Y12_00375 [Sphingobacteriaceae bacterium]|nr:hypothetical protein [Cytophagaceae bacterium]
MTRKEEIKQLIRAAVTLSEVEGRAAGQRFPTARPSTSLRVTTFSIGSQKK